MLEKFKSAIAKNNLWNNNTRLVVACSGGIDSMTLCDLLLTNNQSFSIAHCNFKLRGKESDKDEQFVREYAKENNLTYYATEFKTNDLAKENKQSIQLTARNLRYDWLEKIRKQDGAHFILTAHHLDDQVETMFANIINGTGIKGLHGMLVKQGKIVRPLLEISKDEIESYSKENSIIYREDASNLEDKYQRNFIRHHISPLFKNVNIQYKNNFSNLAKRILDYEYLSKLSIDKIKNKQLINNELYSYISIFFLKNHKAKSTVIYELFSPYGFGIEECKSIEKYLEAPQSGKQFLSDSHRILVDRKRLIIARREAKEFPVQYYDQIPNQILFGGFKIYVNTVPIEKLNVKSSSRYAYFDIDKIEFPLSIRQRKEGDYFYPFGLTKPHSDKVGKKNISKYFKDEKFNAIEKEHTPILFSGEKCIWLVGERIDDRFKVTEQTKNVLKMKIITSPIQ